MDFRRTSDKTHFMNQKNFLVVNQTLPPGTHVYEFEVEIPAECPSSFIGKYGKILYKVDVIASRLMNLNRKFSAEFHVIRPLTNFSVSNVSLFFLKGVRFILNCKENYPLLIINRYVNFIFLDNKGKALRLETP